MNKKKIAGFAGLAAVMVIGGTLAYFNQSMEIENPFDTGKYDSVLVEDFNPSDGDDWEPGATVNKDVEVKNTGDYDLVVRVKFEETWQNKSDQSWAKRNAGNDVMTVSQENADDGLIANDKSVVTKTLTNEDNWSYNSADGYYYYKTNLTKGASTGTFLDSVTLLENADMGKYESINYYTTADARPDESEIGSDPTLQWVQYVGKLPDSAKHSMAITKLQKNAYGYANADYTLRITAQTVQATDAALSVFGLTSQPAGCTWNLTQNK